MMASCPRSTGRFFGLRVRTPTELRYPPTTIAGRRGLRPGPTANVPFYVPWAPPSRQTRAEHAPVYWSQRGALSPRWSLPLVVVGTGGRSASGRHGRAVRGHPNSRDRLRSSSAQGRGSARSAGGGLRLAFRAGRPGVQRRSRTTRVGGGQPGQRVRAQRPALRLRAPRPTT
jgi:hypothetical protein